MPEPKAAQTDSKKSAALWAHTPPLPIDTSPYFRWPIDFPAYLKWLKRSWLPVTERLLFLGLACLCWFYFTPHLVPGSSFEAGWIAQIWGKNFVLMTLIAGSLHLYLYRWRKQADRLKFDRGMANKNGTRFTFNNQVHDNIFWSLVSGVTMWTAYESLLLWAHANGVGYQLAWPDNPYLFIGLFFVIPLWNSFWFFCIHRALHWPFFIALCIICITAMSV